MLGHVLTAKVVPTPRRARISYYYGIPVLLMLTVACSGNSAQREQLSASTRPAAASPLARAPSFSLDSITGEHIDFPADLQGHPTLVNFWASWCPVCKQEARVLADADARWQGSGIVFLGVDVQDELRYARSFRHVHGIVYDSALDPRNRVVDRWGQDGFPASYLIDPRGNIVAVKDGPFASPAEIDSYLVRLAPTFEPVSPSVPPSPSS